MKARTFYICHVAYHHDRVFSENIVEYLEQTGICSKVVMFEKPGPAPELEACFKDDAMAVLGFNSQLDHSAFGALNFTEAARRARIPVIQWILDHSSTRLNEYNNSTAGNSAFLFSSAEAESYFNRHGIPGALTASVACVGPSRHSRADGLSFESFAARPIFCLVAMNLRRVGGTLEDAEARVAALEPALAAAVKEAVARAYPDVVEPLAFHFDRALAAAGLSIPDATRHACMQMIEEIVQIRRRQYIFSVARDYPALIQSDEASRPFQAGAKARFEENVDMALTWSRLKDARAQISVSNMHDMVHDRILNGLNAGCVNIVEDSFANRRAFDSGRNALFFRYDDDSLRACLDLVANDVRRAYDIAAAGFAMRDEPRFRFGDFDRIVSLARRLRWRLWMQWLKALPRRIMNKILRQFR